MSGEENTKPVNIDHRCIQEALRMYLQPIKNDDPQIDFYTMYKRETTEYDTEYMKKYNEDLNTTLIFAGLFSAVSSAFVIDVQSKLQPDSSERSEAYLRAILLSLKRSVSSDEYPAAPPAWGGPPQEIIASSDLLYASLLMSLLAAFVAMLGKQWLNRYLRHTGGSMVERCGDRQRKFDGLEKWPFRLFIESLPIMLQIALLLLTCGLSRHMWSVNTSVARVVISFTVLGILFYIGIVVAGTSSYECPFQTPASIALRHLRDSGATRRFLTSLSPPKIISLILAIWRNTLQGLVSASHRVRGMRYIFSWNISLSRILSGIRRAGRTAGHQTVVLLHQVDRALGSAKSRLVQGTRRFSRTALLPTTTEDTHDQPLILQNGPGLRLRVWNLEALRRQNLDNARCVCWFLRNITDPEAIDSAIRLAGNIRWFNGDSDHVPPFDFIVSTFETCFDSTKRPYPGMRDRAYFSARAILQISAGAKAQSDECASKYPIPAIYSSSFQHTDPDLHNMLCMLEHNFDFHRPSLSFPRVDTNSDNHSLWLTNLFVDLTRMSPNPILASYVSYLSVAVADRQATIANTLLMWYMFLGGSIEEEIFWAVDKSDSLETILSQLSIRVMSAIADGNCPQYLIYLLEFLAAWKERPVSLTPMAYQWCCAIAQRAQQLPRLELQPRDLHLPPICESGFSLVGPGCDPVRLNNTSHRVPCHRQDPTLYNYAHLLPITLEIGFRLAGPGRDKSAPRLNHEPHHVRMLEIAFSSDSDEVIADAVCVWIVDGDRTPPGSCAHYFAERMKRDTPFSPRLRRVTVHAIERVWRNELEASVVETIRLLDRLCVGEDDMVEEGKWAEALVGAIRSPAGLGSLSSHYWRLLVKLVWAPRPGKGFEPRDVEVMRSLEGDGDWEKLEVWMVVVWHSLLGLTVPTPESMKNVEQVTLELLSLQPSALPRFEGLCKGGQLSPFNVGILGQICAKARAKQLSLNPPTNPQLIPAQPPVPFPLVEDTAF